MKTTQEPIAGYSIDLFEGSLWLTRSGCVTDCWSERGIWPTREEAEEAMYKSLIVENRALRK